MVDFKEAAKKIKEEAEKNLKRGAVLTVGLASAMTMGVSRENKEPQNIQNETKPEHHITQENTKPDKDERTITFDEAQQLMDTPQVQLSPEAEISPDTIQSDTPVKEDIAPELTPDTIQIVMPAQVTPEINNEGDTITVQVDGNQASIASNEENPITIEAGYNEMSIGGHIDDINMESTIRPGSVELNAEDGNGTHISAQLRGNKIESTISFDDEDTYTINANLRTGKLDHTSQLYGENGRTSYDGRSLTLVNESFYEDQELHERETFEYSAEGLRYTIEDSDERIVDEYSGMDSSTGMYKRTTYDKIEHTTTVEYGYAGSEPINKEDPNYAQMERDYKQTCRDNKEANKQEWQRLKQGPEATLNAMRETASAMRDTNREALRAGNRLNKNKEQTTIQTVMPSTNETAVKTQDNHQKNTAQKIMGLRGVGNKKSNIKSSDNNTQHNEITDAIKTKISQKIFE